MVLESIIKESESNGFQKIKDFSKSVVKGITTGISAVAALALINTSSCTPNSAQKKCGSDADCLGQELCIENYCSGSCETDYDCPGEELCVDGTCQNDSNTNTNGPYFVGGDRIKVNEDNYVVIANQAILLKDVTPTEVGSNYLTFIKSAITEKIVEKRTVVGSYRGGGGYIRNIVGISRNDNQFVEVETVPGKLTDAFKEAKINVKLGNSHFSGFGRDVIEYEMDWSKEINDSVNLANGINFDYNANFTVGTDGTVDVSLGWNNEQELNYFEFNVRGKVSHTAVLSIDSSLANYHPDTLSREFSNIPLGKIPIFVGLWLSMELQPVIEVDINLEADLEASIGYEAGFDYEAGLKFDGNNLTQLSSFTKRFDLNEPLWEMNGSADARATLWFNLKAQIDDIAGPKFSFGPYAQAEASVSVYSGIECSLEAGVGLDARLGLDMGPLGNWDLFSDLENVYWDLIDDDQFFLSIYNNDNMCPISCSNQCSAGQDGCTDSDTKWECELQSDGCYDKVNYNCSSNEVCDDGNCIEEVPCTDECDPLLGNRCNGGLLQNCRINIFVNDCYVWANDSNCPSNSHCYEGECVPNAPCTYDSDCNSNQVCKKDTGECLPKPEPLCTGADCIDVVIRMYDSGTALDDSFGLEIVGSFYGETDYGGSRTWNIPMVENQTYEMAAYGVGIPDGIGTYTIDLTNAIVIDGPRLTGRDLDAGVSFTWHIKPTGD